MTTPTPNYGEQDFSNKFVSKLYESLNKETKNDNTGKLPVIDNEKDDDSDFNSSFASDSSSSDEEMN